MEYYIQGSRERAEEIKAAFEAKGCTLYRLISQCNSEDLIYYSLKGMVRAIKKDNLYLFEAHPGYTKLELPVKSKFKVEDWIVRCDDAFTMSIKDVRDVNYYFNQGGCLPIKEVDEYYHLWTIADAKDGDVLAINWHEDGDSWEKIVIFKKYHNNGVKGLINSPCVEGYGNTFKNGKLVFDEEIPYYSKTWTTTLQPATKEQRDLLFQKIKEAGYQWDDKKKELRKIKPHYDIKNFKPFDRVLVRDDDKDEWWNTFFGAYDEEHKVFVCDCYNYKQCIPFKGNEHLLGTTDMCDEQYINW